MCGNGKRQARTAVHFTFSTAGTELHVAGSQLRVFFLEEKGKQQKTIMGDCLYLACLVTQGKGSQAALIPQTGLIDINFYLITITLSYIELNTHTDTRTHTQSETRRHAQGHTHTNMHTTFNSFPAPKGISSALK